MNPLVGVSQSRASEELRARRAIEDAQWEERQRVKALEKALEGVEGIGNPPSPESETAQGNKLWDDEAVLSPFTPDSPDRAAPRGQESKPRPAFNLSSVTLSDTEARDALAEWVKNYGGCCTSQGAAKKMEVTAVKPVMFRYVLETFVEWRGSKWTSAPLNDGTHPPDPGAPAHGWELNLQPEQLFLSHVRKMEIPGTSSVKECNKCKGNRLVVCPDCGGEKQVLCDLCDGVGSVCMSDNDFRETKCPRCIAGMRRCLKCKFRGAMTCEECDGGGRARYFKELFAKFDNIVKEYQFSEDNIPADVIMHQKWEEVFQENETEVTAVKGFPEAEITSASQRLVAEVARERAAWHSQRIFCQRQTILTVPVVSVQGSVKGSPLQFWVYGAERRVRCPEYPSAGCTVM